MRIAHDPGITHDPGIARDHRPAFPWDDVLALGLGPARLGGLGWRPRDLWAATPREFARALAPRGRAEPLSRAAFARLLAAHPDTA